MDLKHVIELAGAVLDSAGVLVIVLGVLVSAVNAGVSWARGPRSAVYANFRRRLGRSILLGLELEITGRWPWQKAPASPETASPAHQV